MNIDEAQRGVMRDKGIGVYVPRIVPSTLYVWGISYNVQITSGCAREVYSVRCVEIETLC